MGSMIVAYSFALRALLMVRLCRRPSRAANASDGLVSSAAMHQPRLQCREGCDVFIFRRAPIVRFMLMQSARSSVSIMLHLTEKTDLR
jgi:hypothetical protein